jgi:hypothetical protein
VCGCQLFLTKYPLDVCKHVLSCKSRPVWVKIASLCFLAIKNKAARMILKVVIDDQVYPITVPAEIISGAGDFFNKIDRDMDNGWQMSRDWIDKPNQEQRCQIVGDKMLTAMHNNNEQLMVLLSAYVLARVPAATGLRIDTNGEMLETEVVVG